MDRSPATITDRQPRCPDCNRLLAELVTRPWAILCSRCKRMVVKEGPVQPGGQHEQADHERPVLSG